MQPDEILVALLGRGATAVRYKQRSGSEVDVTLGRNKQARIPTDRILLATGEIAKTSSDFERFKNGAAKIANSLDLNDAWNSLVGKTESVDIYRLSELLWASGHDTTQLIALSIHLEQLTDLFSREGTIYLVKDRDTVNAIRDRQRLETKRADQANILMENLSVGKLPSNISSFQKGLIDDLKEFAIHGDGLKSKDRARSLINMVNPTKIESQKRCFYLLVDSGILSPDEPLEIHRAGIRKDFPLKVISEAMQLNTRITSPDLKRKDMTAVPILTIDEISTVDRDDAVSLEQVGSSYHVGVHIVDASSFIPQGCAVDCEARDRTATAYLPEGNIPMLPTKLMVETGSLDPGQLRPALSLLAILDSQGTVTKWEFIRSLIKSSMALNYNEADAVLEDRCDEFNGPITKLNQITQRLKKNRESLGAINAEHDEMSVKVSSSGKITVGVYDRSSPSKRIIAELMILYNTLMATFCQHNNLPALYRSQVQSDVTDIDEPGAVLRHHMVMKRLVPATTGIYPSPHSSLGVGAYTQVTSPLRRYTDLAMQRQINHKMDSNQALYPNDQIESLGKISDLNIRELARIEESRKRYWFLKYLKQERLEDSGVPENMSLFPATILEPSTNRPALLELDEFPFKVRAQVPRGKQPGEMVTLQLKGVDLWRRTGLFIYLS